MSIFNDKNIIEENNEDEDKYEPVEPLIYNFNALNQLNTNINIIVPEVVKNIYVLGYRVNIEKRFPFLEYLLLKTHNGLDFLKLCKTHNNMSIESLLSVVDTNLTLLLFGMYSNENNNSFIEGYKGFTIYNNNMYVFFDLTNMNIQLTEIYRNTGLWFCLVDEILNTGKICDINILKNVNQFFIDSNREEYKFYHLYDDENKLYEVPKVVYLGIDKQKINFTYTFGVSKKDKSAILGPYYYFTDFKNAINNGSKTKAENYGYILKENELKEEIGGIIRFAIFLGKTKLKTNSLNEVEDLSDIKKDKLSVENEYTNYERMTIRITDYDGNWANDYDTVILEDIQLDDCVKVENTPMYVCKEYDQQIPLSYHYINKKANNNGNESSKYEYLIL
jgi:hypothetical protein